MIRSTFLQQGDLNQDINQTLQPSNPSNLTNVNGVLYFRANDGVNGTELWRIGSSGVAELVQQLGHVGGVNPGSFGSYPSNLTDVNGRGGPCTTVPSTATTVQSSGGLVVRDLQK